jgi:hypothetical protein
MSDKETINMLRAVRHSLQTSRAPYALRIIKFFETMESTLNKQPEVASNDCEWDHQLKILDERIETKKKELDQLLNTMRMLLMHREDILYAKKAEDIGSSLCTQSKMALMQQKRTWLNAYDFQCDFQFPSFQDMELRHNQQLDEELSLLEHQSVQKKHRIDKMVQVSIDDTSRSEE